MRQCLLLVTQSEALTRLVGAALQGDPIDLVTIDRFPAEGAAGLGPVSAVIVDALHGVPEALTLLHQIRATEGIGDRPTLYVMDNPRLLYRHHLLREHDAFVTGDVEAPELREQVRRLVQPRDVVQPHLPLPAEEAGEAAPSVPGPETRGDALGPEEIAALVERIVREELERRLGGVAQEIAAAIARQVAGDVGTRRS